jgi:hypothetical protein
MRRILAFTKETDVIAAIDLLGRGDDPDELEKILKLIVALLRFFGAVGGGFGHDSFDFVGVAGESLT